MTLSKFVKFTLSILVLTLSVAHAQLQLTLPTATGQPGTEAVLEVRVTDMTPYNIQGFQFKILYQSNLIELEEPKDGTGATDRTGTLITNAFVVYGTSVGELRIVAAQSSYMTGSGVLFKIKVKYKALGSTSLTLDPEFSKFSDSNGKVNSTTVNGSITVSNENKPPVFDAVQSKTVNENSELTFSVNAVDPEGSAVIYTTGTLPQGALFNATTKTFTWKPTYQQSGNYSVVFYADDGNSKGSIQVNITVVDVNTAPKIQSIGNKNINEGEALLIEVFATDDEGDNLTYQVTTVLPQGASFDQSTHRFSWTPSYTQSGNYAVTFSVSDGKLTTTQTITIIVANVNATPVIVPISDKTVNSGQTLTIDVVATDADNDNLIYTTANMPTGATFDPITHKFSWKPLGTQAGDHTVIFMVTDSKATATATVKIKVIKVNSAPVFTKKIANGTVVTVHNVQVVYEFQYEATDPDGDALTFSLNSGPFGSTMNSSGLFRWIPTQDQASKSFLILVSVSDGTFTESAISDITTSPLVGIEDEKSGVPTSFILEQNYPNPFNPATTIRFGLPAESNVRIKIYNSIGNEVATPVNQNMSAGYHSVQFSGSNLSSGLYFYKIETDKYSETKKMLLMK